MATDSKRILIISPRPNWGGASQLLLNLLAYEGITNTPIKFLFLFEEDGPSIAEFEKYGSVFVFSIEKYSLFRKIARRISLKGYNLLKFRYAKWVLNIHKPQLVYINSLAHNPSVRAAMSSNIPLVLHAHEMDFLVTMRLSDAFVHKILDRTRLLITCAKAVASFYERTYLFPPEKTFVLHGPVNQERLEGTTSDRNSSSESHTDTITLGVVANISYLKAPDLLIEAFCRIKNSWSKSKKVRLRWLGVPIAPSLYFQSIQNLAKIRGLEHDIEFLPASSHTSSFYKNMDIFILPSRIEAFPLVILEAMLFERPVVAMDVGGVREVVDEETGYLVKDRTPEGLAEGILYFLENEERRQQAGRAGRQRVLEKFEARVQAPKWLKLLSELSSPIQHP